MNELIMAMLIEYSNMRNLDNKEVLADYIQYNKAIDALIEEGFTEDDAITIVSTTWVPSYNRDL